MPWERPYLEALVDSLKPFGQVLEVGFGLGYAASRIQSFHPTHHTILESDPDVASAAREWASSHKHVKVIEGDWETYLPTLGVFDAIFFNECELDLGPAPETTNLIVQKGKELVEQVHQTFPEMTEYRYSTQDLEFLFDSAGTFDPLHMSRFLQELALSGQISEGQHHAMIHKYGLPKTATTAPLLLEPKPDLALTFLKACLQGHLQKGSRLSAFSSRPLSKFENPIFFDEIITNPAYDYQEAVIPIEVPAACTQYPYQEALIWTVEMM